MELSQIRKVSVIGSGIVGHGIGQTLALGGYEGTLNDINDELLQKAIQQIRSSLNTFIEFGIATSEAAEETMNRIKTNKLKRAED